MKMEARIANANLSTLVQIQELDQGLKELRERIRKIPDDLTDLDNELAESRGLVEQAAREQEEGGKERRRLEAEVETLRQKLSKYKDQLMKVATNKEYQAMLHEISGCEQEISAKEDGILESMVMADEWEARQRKAKQEYAARETEINGRRRELEKFLAESESKILDLEAQRAQLRETLAPELIELYERIATVRQGLAVAPAIDQSCQACHVRLRPQLFQEVKTNLQILRCESCNRILYYPEP
jgi:predicted  nucleic acid-binding Zn-ribbon protein